MKVVVINLDKSTERMENMRSQLETLEIEYERFSAVNGRELANIKENATELCTSLLCNPGMIGCALSHMQVLKNFLKSDEDFLCVMEDDIQIKSNIKKFFKDVPEIYRKLDFDMISLFCNGLCKISSFNFGDYVFSKPLFPLGMVTYIVSKKGAKKIIELLSKNAEYHIDFLIAMRYVFRKINYLVLNSPQFISTKHEISSTMGSQCNSIILTLLDKNKCYKTSWVLRVPALTWKLKNSISIYHVILLVFLSLGVLLNLKWMIVFCAVELTLLNWSQFKTGF